MLPMWLKLLLSGVGVFIGGAVSYYQVNSGPGVLLTTPTFWIGFLMAGLAPLASYLLGLGQKAPWDQKENPK